MILTCPTLFKFVLVLILRCIACRGELRLFLILFDVIAMLTDHGPFFFTFIFQYTFVG